MQRHNLPGATQTIPRWRRGAMSWGLAFAAMFALLTAGEVQAQGLQYYGNRTGLSPGIGDGQSQGAMGGLSQGPGGGLSVGPGGGLSVGPGGGLSVGPGGGLSVGPGGGLSVGPGGGLSVGPGGGLSAAPLGGLSVAACGGLGVAPCGKFVPPPRAFLVFFDWDRDGLTPSAQQIVAEAAHASEAEPYTAIEVSGHADQSGGHAYNQILSLKRAQSVMAELVRDGVPRSNINIHAYGDTRPIVPTAAGVREPQNRRVEIFIQQ